MAVITTEKLGATVGAEVKGVDNDRLLHDDELPAGRLEALEANGALVFRDLHLDDATQVAFSRKLGAVEMFGKGEYPEIFRSPSTPRRTRRPPTCAARSTGTSTAAPTTSRSWPRCSAPTPWPRPGARPSSPAPTPPTSDLADDEKERLASVRVVHTIEASQRLFNHDPIARGAGGVAHAPGQGAPARVAARVGPQARSCSARPPTTSWAWTATRAGRCSTSCSPGRPPPTASTATSGRSATWSSGTTAACSTGRCPYDPTSPRDMHRTTFAGDEPIQ